MDLQVTGEQTVGLKSQHDALGLQHHWVGVVFKEGVKIQVDSHRSIWILHASLALHHPDLIKHTSILILVFQQYLDGHAQRTKHWAHASIPRRRRRRLRLPDVQASTSSPSTHVAADATDRLREMLAPHRVVLHDKDWNYQDSVVEVVCALRHG
ncbi:uncharacterized protein BXZ73DRAFT_107515 [Epithele typhae]|uniref:uncharacterized protein n=1 Tax=Epithele typhae TaxID=378194 RepID=UPI002008C109|nr:uncharacterized protein BXZ73DRAFT_107515 [Epithele typhae]KAH9912314.1 hypothetical protein BXZ73DRAFT_107515 [Epithele typhae]